MSHDWVRVDRLDVSGDDVATWLAVGGATVKSGVPWHVEGCTVWKVREGSIASIREYNDEGPRLQALGMGSDA